MNVQIVVADSSCLIVLERVGELSLLEKLFGRVRVTEQVKVEFGELLPDWFDVVKAADVEMLKSLQLNLDKGEATSIAYCLEQTQECLLIIDEKKGRRVAVELGLEIVGTLGLIIRARESALIDSAKKILDRMQAADFRIAPNLRQNILERFGEQL